MLELHEIRKRGGIVLFLLVLVMLLYVVVVLAAVPTHDTPILNSSLGTDTTSENLTVYNISTADGDNDNITNIINWYMNGTSITGFNMPFEADGADNASDYSGHGNDATTLTNVVWNSTGGHNGSGAYYFDSASNSNIQVPADSSFLTGTRGSVSFWVNAQDDYRQSFVGWLTPGDGPFEISTGSGNQLGFYLSDGSASRIGTTEFSSFTPYQNKWTHIVATWNDTGDTAIYINGTLKKTGTYSGTPDQVVGTNMKIGWRDSNWELDGHIDEIMIFNRSLTPEQVEALYEIGTNIIVSNETTTGDFWNATITPNDGTSDGTTKWSNALEIVIVGSPTQGTPILNSSLGTNTSSENITVYNVSTDDPNNNPVKNIINWYRNGTSITILNMPFEADGDNNASDYSGYGYNQSSVQGAPTWNATGGHDGKGAYMFDGDDCILTGLDLDTFSQPNLTICAWAYPTFANDGSLRDFISSDEANWDVGVSTQSSVWKMSDGSQYWATTAPVYTNSWQHICAVWTTGNQLFYLNGSLNTSRGSAPNHDGTNYNLSIGCNPSWGQQWEGLADDVLIFNESLTAQQIEALYNSTDTIVKEQLTTGQVWNATITTNDGVSDGWRNWSNSLTVLNSPPTQGTPILNSTKGTNSTNENITIYNVTTADEDGDSIKNIINWYKDGTSITVLNMPFEADGDQNATDYSSYGNDGTPTGGVAWNSTGGYDGKGAFEFNGSNYINTNGTGDEDINTLSVCAWIKASSNCSSCIVYAHRNSSTELFQLNAENSSQMKLQLRSSGNSLKQLIHNGTDLTQWTHVCGVLDVPNNKHNLYVNGANVSEDNTDFGAETFKSNKQTIGASNTGSYVAFFNGTVDDVLIFNRSLTPEQIQALYNNRTDMIVSNETIAGEVWNATITPNDGTNDGTATWSNRVTILSNAVPLHSTPILNASTVFNTSASNLTIYNQTTRDGDNDDIKNIINWYVDGTSITLLNMPFEADGDQNATDYSGFGNDGTVTTAAWNATGGYDGKGAYYWNGDDYIDVGDLDVTGAITIAAWVKMDAATAPNWHNIICKRFGATPAVVNYCVDRKSGTDELRYVMRTGGTWYVYETTDFNTDTSWTHLAVTYTSGSNAKFYKNGNAVTVSQTSGSSDPALPTDDTATYIGWQANGGSTTVFDGYIDDLMIFNRTLTPDQIEALYNNRTDILVTQETSGGEVWNATLTPNDGTTDGQTLWSNTVSVVANGIPVHTTPILNSTSGNNYTTENITIYNQSTEDEESPVKNIINWYRNGTSFTVLNMPFEGDGADNASDYSGFGNNATTVDGAIWGSTSGYDGKGAFEFAGSNDYIEVTTSDSLNFSTTDFTISYWMNTSVTSPMDAVSKRDGVTNTPGFIVGTSGTGNPFFEIDDGDGNEILKGGPTQVDDGKWHHIAFVFTRSGNAIIYVDGAEDTTQSISAVGDISNLVNLTIGLNGDGTRDWSGDLDDVLIFNESLTAEQVLALYQNRTDVIVASQNFYDETWNATITPNDGVQDGTTLWSNSLTLVGDCTDGDSDTMNASAEGCGPADCNDGDANILPPYRGLSISADTELCSGTYSLGSGSVSLNTDGVTVTCDGTTIVGDSTQTLFNVGYGTDNLTIEGCNFQDYVYAIDWSGSADNMTVRDGIFNDSSNVHIHMTVGDSTGSMLIENNTFEGGGSTAIQIECINCIIRSNTFYTEPLGFRVENTNNLTIENNTFLNSYLNLNSNPKNLTIRYNTFNYSSTHAINAQTGDTLTIYGNNFSNTQGNNYGISVTGSTTNVVVYDNWFNNTKNAQDTSSGNVQWNTTRDCTRINILGGTCTGGNYWHNFTGNDNTADGISDIPDNYTIDSDSIDYLPLTSNNTIGNVAPTQGTPILNSTSGLNSTTENITIYNVSTLDLNRDNVTNIINWYRNGTSITVLNMPLENHTDSATIAKDYSPFQNNGTVYGATWCSDCGHDGKGAYQFDGDEDNITIAQSSSVNITDQLTIEVWINSTKWVSTSFDIVQKFDADPEGNGFEMFVWDGNGVQFSVDDATGSYLVHGQGNFTANEWYHLVGTYNGTDQFFYVNNVLVDSASGVTMADSTDNVVIGFGADGSFNGTISELRIYNVSLSPEQIQALYNNRTDMIVSNETTTGDVWNATITTNDGTIDGWSNWSNSLTILANAIPTHGTPILNSTTGTNASTENLTVYNSSTDDIDNDAVKNIINWYKDGTSILALNMPFEGGSENGDSDGVINGTTDYSNNSYHGNVTGATWSSSGGYDGKGAYTLDGNDCINLGNIDYISTGTNNEYTISLWAKITPYPGARTLFTDEISENNGVMIEIDANDKFQVYWGGGYTTSTNTIAESVWNHIVFLQNSSGIDIYVNGTFLEHLMDNKNVETSNNTYIGCYGGYWRHTQGTIDDVLVYNYALSPEQIAVLYNRTDLIVSQEIAKDEVWNATITPNDGTEDGATKWSNTLTVLNSVPTHGTPLLNSTSFNLTTDNITVWNISTTDKEGDDVKNIINWYKNDTSIYIVNMPFEPGNNLIDYAEYDNNGTIIGTVVYNATGGYDGKGCFEFSGTGGNYIALADTDLNDVFGSGFTWAAWAKHDNQGAGWGWLFDGNDSYVQFGKKASEGELRFDGVSGSLDTVGADVADGNWHHLVATWDGSTKYIYVDGVLNVSGGASGSLAAGGNMIIGDHPGNNEAWDGRIDDVLLLNYSLSAEQIFTLYNNRTDLIHHNETSLGDIWNATITPNDGTGDGTTKWSNTLTIGVGPYPNCAANQTGGAWTITNAQTITDHIECNIIDITSSGSLTVNSSVNNISIGINATNLTIADGGTITANGLGYLMSQGPRAGTDGSSYNQAGGGGHGGKGGKGNNNKAGGNPYGSGLLPTDLGSGGGYCGLAGCTGGSEGGGAIKLIIDDTLILNGTITANGLVGLTSSTYAGGGGAGGSIWINTTVFGGSGNLSAVGGIAGNSGGVSGSAGGGAGGRVVVYYNTTSINITHCNVSGGWADTNWPSQKGDPGTLGFIDKDDNNIEIYQGFEFQEDASYENITIFNSTIRINGSLELNATNIIKNTTWLNFTCYNTGYDFTLNVDTDLNLSNSNIKNLGLFGKDCNNVNLIASSNTITLVDSLTIEADGNTTLDLGNNQITINSSTITLDNALSWFDLGSISSLILESTTITGNVNWSLTNLTIDASSIIADNKGYPLSEGLGAGTDGDIWDGAGGAGHGGAGGRGDDTAYHPGGPAYDTIFSPIQVGSGGGYCGHANCNSAGAGGGAIKLIVTDTFNFNGTLSANGQGGAFAGAGEYAGGGGSGGSIFVNTSTFTGSGNFSAYGGIGGQPGNADGGGGAGGRVTFYYNTSTFTGLINVSGGITNTDSGARYGNNGSVFICQATTISCNPESSTILLTTDSTISVRTNYSINATNQINKTIVTAWSSSTLSWNDSASNAATVAFYNVTGLKATTNYTILNNSIEIAVSPLATDASGNLPMFSINLSSEHEINISETDQQPPTITLISPPNANFTNSSNVTFICNATDATNVSIILLYHNISQAFGENQTVATSGIDVQAQFNVTNIADGNYTWNCLSNDSLNNTGFATTNNTFVVDTTTPTISLIITATPLEYGLDETILDWGALDTNLYTKLINITYPNGTLLINSTNDTANITLDPLLDLTEVGQYAVTGFANDSASNSKTGSATITVQDTMPPDLVMQLAPTAPALLNTRNVTIECDASDTHLITNVTLYHNISQPFGVNQTVITSDTMVTESFNLTNIPDGSYVTACYAADYSNNSLFDQMGNNTLQIDATSPTIAIGLSTSTPEFGVENVVIDWNVTDTHVGTKYMNVTYPNGTFIVNATNDTLDVTLNTATLNVLGNYTIIVTANDTFSNNQTSSTTFIVQDTNLSTVSLESPPNSNYTNLNNLTLICNATDNINVTNISLYHNISQAFGLNQTINTSGTTARVIFTVNNTPDGNYTWNCLAYDYSNNTVFATSNNTIIVDTIAPNVTAITPVNSYIWNTSDEVSFIFNVTDTLSNKTNCSLFINDTYYQGNDTVTNITNNYTQTLDSGNYTWFISCFDSANNVQNSTTRNLTMASLFGELNITWITPTANINVNHNEFFLMTVNVSCEGGPCGNVTITLDPEPINETNETIINETTEIEINETEEEINETLEIENNETQTNNTTNTNTTQTNETINETIEEQENNETIEDLDDITEEINFEFFTLKDTYTLGETVYFYILPTNATYTINITPMSGTLNDLEFTPTQSGNYNITSTLELENQSETFDLTLTVIEPIEETETNTTINQTQAQTYEEGENITQEDKHLGEKLEDEIHFETYFTNITQTNETLTITFYHDYTQSLPVWIEATDVQYTLSTINAEPYENTTLEVTLVEGIIPRFNLHLGEESEVFEFGKVIPDVDIDHGDSQLIDRIDEKLDINITKNNNSINLEGVAEETDIYTYIEPTEDFPTDIIAVEPLEIEQATITLTTDTIITTIFECPDELFNYETLECLEWNQTNITFTQEDNQITFTVNHFSGYAGGNITNNQTSYLTIWDELDQGEPNTTNAKLLNQNTLFFANYLTTQNLTKITNGNCTLNFSNTLYPMTYNTSYTYYVVNRSFATAGTYTYTITCTHSTYSNITAQDDIRVPTNKGVVPTTVSAPFYTNGTNPQLCLNVNETNPCVMSWWVNATGTPGLSYEFYAYADSSYTNDVDSVNSSFLNITIRSNETTEPIIITTNSTPVIAYLGQNISLSATASDNTQVDDCYANITLPNSSIIQVNNTCTAQQTYTTTTLGRHNITFIVNDTSSNIITNTDNYFIVYAVLNFTATLNDSNGSLNTNLQLIHSETQELVRQDDINGTYDETIPDTIYDLLYRSYGNRLQVRLRQVNLSNETGNTFGMDKLSTPITGYLLTYGIDTNYSFSNSTVIVYYDDATFSNENRLRLYKCDNWDFNLQQCNGTWVDVTNDATQNTANDYFEYLTTSFSGFSVGQTSSSSSGSGGSSTGTWQKIITPAQVEPDEPDECIPDWYCPDWQECKDNLKRRYCYDLNDCNSPVATPHMIESCEESIQITDEPTIIETTTEQEIIVDFKKGEKTDKTKLGYMLLLVLLISYLIYICYKNKPKFDFKSFNLNKKLKLPVFKLPKFNLSKYKQSLNKKLPKSLKQLKEWFYRF